MTKIENISRDIVAEWLVMFDPPPQIDFQQSEMLQASIAAALRARPAQEPLPHGYNSCLHTAIQALNFLSSRPRPIGGQDAYNAEHLLQIADEIKRTIAHNIQCAQSGEESK
jgi:hypothetical protein